MTRYAVWRWAAGLNFEYFLLLSVPAAAASAFWASDQNLASRASKKLENE